MRRWPPNQRRGNRKGLGSTLLEFSVVLTLVLTVIFGELEIGRAVLTYTALANAAREGARYAVVHGSGRTGSGPSGPSGPGSFSEVTNVVRTAAFAARIPSGQPNVNVTYANGSNAAGSTVTVVVSYDYSPVTPLLPLTFTLGSTSSGMICF